MNDKDASIEEVMRWSEFPEYMRPILRKLTIQDIHFVTVAINDLVKREILNARRQPLPAPPEADNT